MAGTPLRERTLRYRDGRCRTEPPATSIVITTAGGPTHPTVGGRDRHQPRLRINAHGLAARPVLDPERTVVAAQDDAVSDRELLVAHDPCLLGAVPAAQH